MIEGMQIRNFAARTQESYVRAVEFLAKYYGRSPDQLTDAEVQHYLYHLIVDRKLSWSSCNVAVCAFRFLYAEVLQWDTDRFRIPARKTESRLPEILSQEEVERLFNVTRNPKHRVLLKTTYAAGLRVSEVVRLRVTDIDSSRMMIRVDQGKGRKDRYTLLSERLLGELREYWKLSRPPRWLFPGRALDRHMVRGTAQRVYSQARTRAGITKEGGIHTLRHCFGTHLLEAGVDIAVIQKLMGHRSIRTTLRYLQVTRHHLHSVPSLLDLLNVRKLQPRG